MNTIQKLHAAGQSVWYDNIERRLLSSGEMAGMIAREEIWGVTSNPTIFMNAIGKTQDYDAAIAGASRAGYGAQETFYRLAIEDIQAAADLFLPMYRQTGGEDGYVSLEVSPYLAADTLATLEEAKKLWRQVDRPNLMIKIPATLAGLPAVTAAIAEGINVNVTLIFSRRRYAAVMDAYLQGLERRSEQGLPLDSIASVASFFVSRVDTKVDALLAEVAGRGGPQGERASALLGKAAVANARLAYADFKAFFDTTRFQELQARGARFQRPLWASTGTKNPQYSDVLYVEELVGPYTVNTVPPQTLRAFLDHGRVRSSLEEGLDEARADLQAIEDLGIRLDEVTQQLEVEGVKAFADSFTALLRAVEQRREASLAG